MGLRYNTVQEITCYIKPYWKLDREENSMLFTIWREEFCEIYYIFVTLNFS